MEKLKIAPVEICLLVGGFVITLGGTLGGNNILSIRGVYIAIFAVLWRMMRHIKRLEAKL